eukprot:jgi/Botrbrau1/16615/Bobra.0068s0041.1
MSDWQLRPGVLIAFLLGVLCVIGAEESQGQPRIVPRAVREQLKGQKEHEGGAHGANHRLHTHMLRRKDRHSKQPVQVSLVGDSEAEGGDVEEGDTLAVADQRRKDPIALQALASENKKDLMHSSTANKVEAIEAMSLAAKVEQGVVSAQGAIGKVDSQPRVAGVPARVADAVPRTSAESGTQSS